MTYNTSVVMLGVSLLGAATGLIGAYAVLRRRALLGDALSHAALPGLCLGFWVVGERNLAAMLIGALLSGLLGICIVSYLRHSTKIREDAAIGIVLSVFFGAGIVLSRLIQNSTAISGSKAGLDSYILGKTAGMGANDLLLIVLVAVVVAVLVLLLFKEFLLISFDLAFARVQGWPSRTLELLLTGLIAVVVVVGLPAVGVVMMAALLILPGVTARFWTERLSHLLSLATGIGAVIGAVGTWLSATFEQMPAGPVITLVGTALFCFSALIAPKRGLLARWYRRIQHKKQTQIAEFLRLQLLIEQNDQEWQTFKARKSWSDQAIKQFQTQAKHLGYWNESLTPLGRAVASEITERYLLWKALIEHYPDLASLAEPYSAARMEESLPPEILDDLRSKIRISGIRN